MVGSKYAFSAAPASGEWPDGYPSWEVSLVSALPANDYPKAYSGEEPEPFEFEYDAVYTITVRGPEGYMQGRVRAITPSPFEINFAGPGNEVLADVGTNPEWSADAVEPLPACYVRPGADTGTGMSLEATFRGGSTLEFPTEVEVGVNDETAVPLMFGVATTTWQDWPSGGINVSQTGTENLEDAVYKYDGTFFTNWRYRVTNGVDRWFVMRGGSIGHDLCVIYAPHRCPDEEFTAGHLKDVFKNFRARGAYEEEVANALNVGVSHNLYGGCICPKEFGYVWDAAKDVFPANTPDDERGMCCCRALGLIYALEFLGIGPYTQIYCNEMPEDPWGTDKHRCVGTCSEHGRVTRDFWASGILNVWEAARSAGIGTTAYAPGGGPFTGTYDAIAGMWEYRWYHGLTENDSCGPQCVITGDGECVNHSIYWGRFPRPRN